MSDSPLWTNAAPPPMFTEGGLTVAVTDGDNDNDQPPAATVPPTPPRDPNLPAWHAERMACRVLGRIAIMKFARFEPLPSDVGQLLSRKRDEALAEWLKSDAPQKYLRLRDQLTKAEEERITAARRELQARLAYNTAIEKGDAQAEAEAWEQARAEVADNAVRISSIQEATDVAYAIAHDSYREHNNQMQNGNFAASCQTYSQALEELAAAVSKHLDACHDAQVLRDRQQSFPAVPIEKVLPSPSLPVENLDPPVPDSQAFYSEAGIYPNHSRPRRPVNIGPSEPAAV